MWTYKKEPYASGEVYCLWRGEDYLGFVYVESDAKAICEAMNAQDGAVDVLRRVQREWDCACHIEDDTCEEIDRILLSR